MRILVTAGPTREPLDAVRFLSNPSSGKMGFACARAARRAGHRVTLVTGPVALPDPPGVRTVRVTTALEMRRAVLAEYPGADAVVMTAAVGDYRPARRYAGKLKKDARVLTLRLVRTPDILRALGRRKGRRILVGFALEVQDAVHQALLKYKRKNLDLVLLNSPRTFAADRMNAVAYREGRVVRRFRRARKEAVARWIVRAVEALAAGRSI
ncbi:MAG TPA: phosphopantothenoylcysteine decarboxylase [Planctomycetota bacterium]|jgi:phosphopantothenoylcysteine decarboxylase/phosphopantothenate--cysteine ligase|nr:phosphopantothenoylcysteine decarboxylase [Planctomycetota bacterium]